MQQNVSSIDRMFRIVIGFGLLMVALIGGQAWGWIGIVPLVTGLTRFCPLYMFMPKKECPVAPENKDEQPK